MRQEGSRGERKKFWKVLVFILLDIWLTVGDSNPPETRRLVPLGEQRRFGVTSSTMNQTSLHIYTHKRRERSTCATTREFWVGQYSWKEKEKRHEKKDWGPFYP